MVMDFSVISNNIPLLAAGTLVTLKLASLTIVFSLILGTLLGTIRYLKIPVLSQLVTALIEFTRAIPLIMYIVFIHYTISAYIFYNLHLKDLLHLNSTAMQSGFLALILFTSAYIAEIVRGGFNSIDKEQIFSAKALGLTSRQTMQYIFIPIALYRMLPSLLAQFVTLIKDTSLVSAIGLVELTRAGEFIYETNHKELEVLLFVSLIYFTLCFLLSRLAKHISQKPFLTETT